MPVVTSIIPKALSVEYLTPPIADLKELSPKLYSQFEDIWTELEFLKVTFAYKEKGLTGYVVAPKKETRISGIIYNRGGVGNFGRLENKHIYYILANMASWGYVVAAVEYGDFDEYGGEDVEYVRHFYEILQDYPKLDSSRIGLYGASRGGMMNYLLLQDPTFAKCAVIKAGVNNQERGYTLRPDLRKIDARHYPSDEKEEVSKRSVVDWSQKLSTEAPILLLHGTGDTQVLPLDSLETATLLYQHNIPFSLYMFNGDNHRLNENKKQINKETRKWFNTYLSKEEKSDYST